MIRIYTGANSLAQLLISHVGIGSKEHCLLADDDKIFFTSVIVIGLKLLSFEEVMCKHRPHDFFLVRLYYLSLCDQVLSLQIISVPLKHHAGIISFGMYKQHLCDLLYS